jgi:hypothetical protein
MKMNAKQAIAGYIPGLLTGFLLFFLLAELFSSVPSDHQAVIDKFAIKVDGRYWLEPSYVNQTTPTWLKLIELYSVDFRSGNDYMQSIWVWQNPEIDADFSCTVWGPDENGNGYFVEFGRLCGYDVTIYSAGQPVAHFEEISDWSVTEQLGYAQFEVVLS